MKRLPLKLPVQLARMRRGELWLMSCLAAACFISVYGRIASSWELVTGSGSELRLLGIDPYYHLRHTLYAVEHFPEIQRWDVGTHYPTGERSPHAGLFNWTLALLALVLGLGNPSEELVTWIVAWSPMGFHALTLILVYFCTLRATSTVYAVTAVAVFACFPGLTFARSLFGFGDHHAAEVFLLLSSMWGLTALLRRHRLDPGPAPEGLGPRLRSWLQRGKFALPLLVFQLTWSGAPLFIALFAMSLVVALLVDVWRDFDLRAAGLTALDFGVVLSSGLFFAKVTLPDAIMIEELFEPSIGLSLAWVGLGLALLGAGPKLSGALSKRTAAGVVSISALALGGLLLWWVPERYFDMVLMEKTSAIREHQAVTWSYFLRLQGLFGAVALAGPIVVGVAALRRELLPELTTTVLTILVVILWVQTRDYGYLAPPLLAVTACIALSELTRRWQAAASPAESASQRRESKPARRRKTKGSRRRPPRMIHATPQGALFSQFTRHRSGVWRWLPMGLVLASVVQIWPVRAAPNPLDVPPGTLVQINTGWMQAMQWLRTETEPPRPGVLDRVEAWQRGRSPFGSQSYGVASAWDYGNFVAALGRRTPLWSHGIGLQLDRWLLSAPGPESVQSLCPQCRDEHSVRYVVLSAPTLAEHFMTKVNLSGRQVSEYSGSLGTYDFHGVNIPLRSYGSEYAQSMAARLYLGDANGLEHFRLVYASPHQSLLSYRTTVQQVDGKRSVSMLRVSQPLDDPEQRAQAFRVKDGIPIESGNTILYGHQLTASVKIFEIVRGVRISGIASPGVPVSIHVGLEVTTTDQEFVYHQRTTADSAGRFSLVFPYSSRGASPTVVAASDVQLAIRTASGDVARVFKLSIEERAVREGTSLDLGRVDSSGTLANPGRDSSGP